MRRSPQTPGRNDHAAPFPSFGTHRRLRAAWRRASRRSAGASRSPGRRITLRATAAPNHPPFRGSDALTPRFKPGMSPLRGNLSNGRRPREPATGQAHRPVPGLPDQGGRLGIAAVAGGMEAMRLAAIRGRPAHGGIGRRDMPRPDRHRHAESGRRRASPDTPWRFGWRAPSVVERTEPAVGQAQIDLVTGPPFGPYAAE